MIWGRTRTTSEGGTQPRRLLAALLGATTLVAPAIAQPGDPAEAPDRPERVIRSPMATLEDRAAAARAILAEPGRDDLSILHLALLEDFPRGARRSVGMAIHESGVAPTDLAPALASAIALAENEALGELLLAARLYLRREVVGAVVGALARIDDSTRPIAIETLRAQTGLGLDEAGRGAWEAWWREGQPLTDAAWYADLAGRQADRLRELERRRLESASELDEAYKRMHVLVPDAERGAFIAELIRAESPAKRRSGFELADAALRSARSLGPDVLDACRDALASPDRGARLRAATVLDRSAATGYGAAAVEALRAEDDPAVVAPLLGVLTRDPTKGASAAVVRWAREGGAIASAARAAAVALIDAGVMTDDTQINRLVAGVVAALERDGSAGVSLTGVRLLALGRRWDELETLLGAERSEIAVAAGDALSRHPERWRSVVSSAADRPELFAPAASAIGLNDTGASGLTTLSRLPAPSDDARVRACRAHAQRLSPADLLRALEPIDDAALRQSCLAPVVSPANLRTIEDETIAARLIELAARSAVEADRGAWITEWAGTLPDEIGGARAARARVVALLGVDQIEDAAAIADRLGVDAGAWLEACDRTDDEQLAARIAADGVARFGDEASAELDALRALAGTIAGGDDGEAEAVGDGSDGQAAPEPGDDADPAGG